MNRAPATFADAVTWLSDHAATDLPTKMHDRATGDDGAPRLSDAFIRWLTRDETEGATSWAFETAHVTFDEDCPRPHPIRGKGEPRCEMCDDALFWTKTRPMYVRPFMAALERLRSVSPTSHDWPTPHVMVVKLMACGYDLELAASSIGHPILGDDHRKTLEAAFVIAVRRLVERYSSGPIPKRGPISDNQAQAEAAA